MIYVQKIVTKKKHASTSFHIEGVDEEKNSLNTIWKYLTDHLGCKTAFACHNGVPFDFSRDGITFKFDFGGMAGYNFRSSVTLPSGYSKNESPEYYDKLEKIAQELVDALNRDNHILDIALK